MTLIERIQSREALLTLNEVAALLGSHPQTLYKACRKGKMPHLKHGGRIKFDPASLASFLQRGEIG